MAIVIKNLGKYIGTLTLILILAFSLIENPFRWPAPHQLRTTQAIDQSIIDASGNQPFNFALLAKMNYDPGYKYFFYENNSPLFSISEKITDQLFVVCEPFQMDCNPINNPEWSVAAFGWAKIDREWEIDGIKIYRLLHTQEAIKQ